MGEEDGKPGPKRILVIESNARYMQFPLAVAAKRSDQYELLWAQSSHEAKAIIEKYQTNFTMIIFDDCRATAEQATQGMLLELAKELKKNGFSGVMVSSCWDPTLDQALRAAGCAIHIPKIEIMSAIVQYS